jgi:hypothetical protein
MRERVTFHYRRIFRIFMNRMESKGFVMAKRVRLRKWTNG